MRILFISACYKPYFGGIERVAEQVCRRLAAKSAVEKVGILTSYYRYPSELMAGLPAEENLDGATVYRLRFLPRRLPGFYHLDTGLFAPGMSRVVQRFQPTHVHYLVYDWYLPNVQAHLLTRRRAGQVMTIFDHQFQPGLRTWPFEYANRWLTRRADAVHVVSQRAREIVTKTFGTPAERIAIIPLGSDSAEQGVHREKDQPITILCVGRLCEKKGQMELLHCFQRVVARVAVPCRLVLVGDADAGGDRAALERVIAEYQLREKVIITGHIPQEELEAWYAQSDVFALLTRDESFGLVFTEAMSHGLPVIAYAVGGVPEVLKNGAILLRPGDTDAVEGALQRLIQDEAKRAELSREARAFAQQQYSWDRTADQLMQVYVRTVRKKTQPTWEKANEGITSQPLSR
ncbi:MAG: glycosyltransferase family 4 protein [Candidatus Hydrogenedentes bacterium]|nr:glycosyltransferase family 4 protein [Candidatus Hydrogenedentota bacterium]